MCLSTKFAVALAIRVEIQVESFPSRPSRVSIAVGSVLGPRRTRASDVPIRITGPALNQRLDLPRVTLP